MVCITVFHAGDDDYGVMPSAEYDGDPAAIVHDYGDICMITNSIPTTPKGRPSQPAAAEIIVRFPLPLAIKLGYTRPCAMVVVGGAAVRPFVTEKTTMFIIGLAFSIFGIGFFCWLLFTLAVYALPFFAGVNMFLAAFHSGAGVMGSIVVGALAGGATLAIGQIVFATVRVPIIRALIALLYAIPAAVAGCYATLGLSQIGVPSETWRVVFAVVGSAVVGGTAWARMWAFVPPPYERGTSEHSVSVPLISVARNG